MGRRSLNCATGGFRNKRGESRHPATEVSDGHRMLNVFRYPYFDRQALSLPKTFSCQFVPSPFPKITPYSFWTCSNTSAPGGPCKSSDCM